MSERPKRIIAKPRRYKTTSSDEASSNKRKKVPSNNVGEIEKDVQDIRRHLEEEGSISSEDDNFDNYNKFPQYSHTSSRTSTQPNTNIQSPNPRDTNIQSYINNETHTHTQSYINLQPACSSSHNTYIPQATQSCTQYANNTFTDFQDNYSGTYTRREHDVLPSENWNVGIERSTHGHGYQSNNLTQLEKSDINVYRKIHERLDRVETEMKRINSNLEKVLRCVQDRHRAPQKPAIFPIASLADMDAFERFDEDEYSNVVNYFRYIGGFNLREAANLCLKESLKDVIATSFTWWGREGNRPLYNTRLIVAIYDGVCQNKHFEKPTRSEFQAQMREALRMSKERYRSRSRKNTVARGARNQQNRRDLWNDERLNDEQPIERESTDEEVLNN